MSAATAAVAIQGIVDRLAKGRQTLKSAFSTGNTFWTRVDAAADETFENRVKGSTVTAFDTSLNSASYGSTTDAKGFCALLNSYLQVDLALAAPYLEKYLDLYGWRVPYEFAQYWYEATGNRLSAQYVFGKGTRVASGADPSASGMHKFATWAGTATVASVDGALVNCASPVLITSTDATPGGTSPTLTVTLSDGATTRDIAFTPSATQYGQVLLGSQAIGAAGAASGQKVIPLSATAQFAANTYALVVKADYSACELVYVKTVTANTSITVDTNLINSWVQNDLVIPLVTAVAYKSGSITSGKNLAIWAWPDRIIAL